MDRHTDFVAYCIEEYKFREKMTGRNVIELFDKYAVVDYIRSCYESLHTTGDSYIVEDINLYIKARA